MPIPDGVPRRTLTTGLPYMSPGGGPAQGRLTFTGPDLVTVGPLELLLGGGEAMYLEGGLGSIDLVPCDVAGMNPTGWPYRVDAEFADGTPGWTRYVTVPSGSGALQLADVLSPDPVAGVFTTLVDPSSLGGAALLDVGTTTSTVAAGDDARFGRLGGTITLTGTPTAGQVPTATSGTAATWQTPAAGGGGGASIRTASARITDDNLSGLPSAAAWAIVTTSAGTPLQAQIAAAAGDRIRVCANYMRSGSHFLDWALLDSAGAIAQYAGSGTATPLGEGNPAMYPSLSFSYVTSSELFVVDAGNIDGTGKATVALAHQGTGAGLVYAHSTYPWRLRLENLGPEPT